MFLISHALGGLARSLKRRLPLTALLWLASSATLIHAECQPEVAASLTHGGARSVAIDGNWMAIGAPNATVGGALNAGRVIIYKRNAASQWVLDGTFNATDVAPNRLFGHSVAIDGTTVLVGSPQSIGGANPGSAYIFERIGGQWLQRAKLVGNDTLNGDRFGISVALEGEKAVIGANWHDAVGSQSGAAYVFEGSGGNWNQSQKLLSTDPSAGEIFGSAVALHNGMVLVGCPYDKLPTTTGGSVFIFGAGGGPPSKLVMDSPVLGSMFGASIAIDDEKLVVAAPSGVGADTIDCIQIYDLEGGAFGPPQKIMPPAGIAWFGGTVMTGPGVVAATGLESGSPSGRVVFYTRVDGVWTQSSIVSMLMPEFDQSGISSYRYAALEGESLAAAFNPFVTVVNTCGGIGVLDPNWTGTNQMAQGAIVNDPSLFATGGLLRNGLVADGVTRLVLRSGVSGPGNVTFSLSSGGIGIAGVGGLLSLDGQGPADPFITVPAVQLANGDWMAFAQWRAPTDFVVNGSYEHAASRSVTIDRTFVPAGGGDAHVMSRSVEVRRPPVLLIHGIWSSATTWHWNLESDSRFVVHCEDYRQSNAASFAANVRKVRRGIQSAVAKVRAQGIAATRADVIGHSMGGLLSRLYSSGYAAAPYFRPDNFNQGDIHKLITVDTPHLGSPLASLLIFPSGLRTPLGLSMEEAGAIGCVNCGAVSDLRPDASVYSPMPATPEYAAHAFVGRGGTQFVSLGVSVALGALPPPLRALVIVLDRTGAFNAMFPGSADQDLIVGGESQRGGLAGGHTTVFEWSSINPPVLAIHTTVTSEDPQNQRAIQLLNTPATDGTIFASGFPQISNGFADAEDFPVFEFVPGVAMTPLPPSSTAGGSIPVSISTFDGFQPTIVLYLSEYGAVESTLAPFNAILPIAHEALGPMRVAAMAFDAEGQIAVSEIVSTQVTTSASLTSLSVTPEEVFLFDFEPSAQLGVDGTFNDGWTRDLVKGEWPLTFQSLDPSVATVDADGQVSAVAIGETAIVVTTGAMTTYANVTVESVPQPLLGDINGDGVVNGGDIAMVLGAWGTNDAAADLNDDGVVAGADISIVLSNWS